MKSKLSLERRVAKLESIVINNIRKEYEYTSMPEEVPVENLLAAVQIKLDNMYGPSEIEDNDLLVCSLRPDIAESPRDEGYIQISIEDNICVVELYDWDVYDREIKFQDEDEVEIDRVIKSFDRDVDKIVNMTDNLIEYNS